MSKPEDDEAYVRAKQMLDAETKILEALRPLTQRSRRRVLTFVADYLDEQATGRHD